jgi:type VI secretion system protein ImpM
VSSYTVIAALDMDSIRIGFFGKLPSRGDFVRFGLSRALIAAWDNWLQEVMFASHEVFGSVLSDAPIWRFEFGAGVCGPRRACGLLLPSADSVGRMFPLMIAAEAAMATDAFLDAVERIGVEAIRHTMPPETVAQNLNGAPRPSPARDGSRATRWWRREGTSDACELIGDALPDAATFLRMLSS